MIMLVGKYGILPNRDPDFAIPRLAYELYSFRVLGFMGLYSLRIGYGRGIIRGMKGMPGSFDCSSDHEPRRKMGCSGHGEK